MLTDEDKQWILERLGKVEERFEERLGKVEMRFEERLGRAEERSAERLERVETTLLTEFHKWASPIEMRLRSHTAVMRALDEEVETISDRLKNLENRQAPPSQ